MLPSCWCCSKSCTSSPRLTDRVHDRCWRVHDRRRRGGLDAVGADHGQNGDKPIRGSARPLREGAGQDDLCPGESAPEERRFASGDRSGALPIHGEPGGSAVGGVEGQRQTSRGGIATANAAIPNAEANLAKVKAADELAKTQEQIALNIQRQDKAAISVLNVAKATQEREQADAAVLQAEAGLAQAQAAALQAAAAVQTAKATFLRWKLNWMTRDLTSPSAR